MTTAWTHCDPFGTDQISVPKGKRQKKLSPLQRLHQYFAEKFQLVCRQGNTSILKHAYLYFKKCQVGQNFLLDLLHTYFSDCTCRTLTFGVLILIPWEVEIVNFLLQKKWQMKAGQNNKYDIIKISSLVQVWYSLLLQIDICNVEIAWKA